MANEDGRDTWSNLTIDQILAHLNMLKMRVPYLTGKLTIALARGSSRGADITVSLSDEQGIQHVLMFEVEQYASGRGHGEKIVRWAERHNTTENSMTVVISLVMQAFFNRITGSYCEDESIRQMVYSKNFRIYAGSGDGRLTDELKTFITLWIEERL
ncbi:MAG TPA: hypothetical protein VFX97_04655 [Pyrinomonadaceae bacterium]|nr:hypothetical protein [Pyrinomonadaceae bacterium]